MDVQEGLIFNFNPVGPPLDGKASQMMDSDTDLPPTYIPNPNAPAENAPGFIYALIEKEWKYVVYYDLDENKKVDWAKAQYKMYDLKNDWSEMNNLLPINAQASEESLKRQKSMYVKLSTLMNTRGIENLRDGMIGLRPFKT